MDNKEYLETAYYNLRGWLRELNTNERQLAHLAERAIVLLKQQIEWKKRQRD